MNKQQLAAKIWESANKMRSTIEANEYKDYILGFIFYKFLSDKEVKYLKELGYTDEDMNTVTEDDDEIVENIQKNIGYFISYDNLFSTWLAKAATSVLIMLLLRFQHLVASLIFLIRKCLIRSLKLFKQDFQSSETPLIPVQRR